MGIDFQNETLSGVVLLPAGETHRFYNTITLDQATVELEGYLRNEQQPVVVRGDGVVNIHGPYGIWTDGWTGSHLTIEQGVEARGYFGSRLYVQGANYGVLAALPGGDGGLRGDKFTVALDAFTNEGLIESRPGGNLRLALNWGLFQNNGEIRIAAEAQGEIVVHEGYALSPQALGTLHNDGLLKLEQFRISGPGDLNLNGSGVWELGRYSEIVDSTINIPTTATARVVSASSPPVRLSGVTINGVLESASLADTSINGGLTLNGEWRLLPSAEVFFNGEQEVAGQGELVTVYGRSILRSVGGAITIGPDIDLRVPGGSTQWLAGERFILQGTFYADGGALDAYATSTTNQGVISVTNGGALTLGSSAFTNEGTIHVESGSRLNLDKLLINQGSVSVADSTVFLQVMPQGDNPIEITDSSIEVLGNTLSELQALPRTRSEFVTAGSIYGGLVDLEGLTLLIADQDNQRWSLRTGGLENGRVASEDGFELAVVGDGAAVLRNLTLDADVRVPSGAELQINQGVSGAGRVIVDGGRVQFSGPGNTGAPMTSDVVAMVSPQPGAEGSVVQIYGPMDNTDRTIYMKAGARWLLDSIRTTVITGGRIEGDPGVELEIAGGYPRGDLVGVTLAAPARVISGAYITGGLTLDLSELIVGGLPGGDWNATATAQFAGEQTLGGVGEVRFAPSQSFDPENPYATTSALRISGGRLTIGAGVTLNADGGDGVVHGGYSSSAMAHQPAPLTNLGTLLAAGGHTLTLLASEFVQQGVLRAESGGRVAVEDLGWTNEGALEIVGGAIATTGDLQLAGTSNLLVELTDPAFAPETPLVVGGGLTLGGGLAAQFAEGFNPTGGDVYPIAAASQLAGDFASWTLPRLSDGLYWGAQTTPNNVSLLVLPGAPAGDYNSDGVVDAADYSVWRDQVGSPAGTLPNDPSGEVIGPAQYALWREQYRAVASLPPPSSPAPTPGSLALVVIGAAGVFLRYRR